MNYQKKLNSESSKNVLALLTGTSIAQAIPIAATPLLTRIYTPEDFGLLALFLSVTMIFSSIVSARYELAILLPEDEVQAVNVAALAFSIATVVSIVLALIVVTLNAQVTMFLGNDDLGVWLYFVPIVVWLTGVFNILNYLKTRKTHYTEIAKANVYKSLAASGFQTIYGLLRNGASGLILGQILGIFVGVGSLFNSTKWSLNFSTISSAQMGHVARKYIKFPRYTMWGGFANTLAQQLPYILISSFYGISLLGFYSLTQRALGAPSALISSAIGQVFYEEASKEKNRTGRASQAFRRALIRLLIIGIPIFTLLYFFVVDVFIIFFGEGWEEAGIYARIMMPLFFFRFVIAPLTSMNIIFEKNKIGMYWQFGLFSFQVVPLTICWLFGVEFIVFLKWLAFMISGHYILIFIIVSKYNSVERADDVNLT